jgi:hypothetical protein
MKIVINRCFGGFGLSNEAFEMLLHRKGIEFEIVIDKVSFGQERYEYYCKGHVGEKDHCLSQYDFHEDRSDPDLVAVVEELGDRADGWASELVVVEVPDNVKWHIEEYDGSEHIAEDHRTWS